MPQVAYHILLTFSLSCHWLILKISSSMLPGIGPLFSHDERFFKACSKPSKHQQLTLHHSPLTTYALHAITIARLTEAEVCCAQNGTFTQALVDKGQSGKRPTRERPMGEMWEKENSFPPFPPLHATFAQCSPCHQLRDRHCTVSPPSLEMECSDMSTITTL